MQSPYMNTREVALYLRFVSDSGEPNLNALWHWLRRHQVRTRKRGRAVLVHVDDIEAALTDRRRV